MLSVGLHLLLEFSEKNSHSGSGGLLTEFSSMQYRTEVLFSASIGHSHHLDHDFIFKVYTGANNSSHALFFLIFFSAVTLLNWKYSLLRSRVIYNELIGIFLNNSHLKVFNLTASSKYFLLCQVTCSNIPGFITWKSSSWDIILPITETKYLLSINIV